MNPPTDWGPGVAALLAALAAGFVLLMQSRRGAALPSTADTRRQELQEQKEALYTLLRDHVLARDRMAADAWAAERDRMELQAARVLRDLDRLGAGAPVGSTAPAATTTPAATPTAPATASTPPRDPTFGERHPQLVGALWGAGAMIFVGALYFGIQEFSAPRGQNGSVTGRQMGGGGGDAAAMQVDQEIEGLRAKVAANPADVAARNELGHALLHTGEPMEAFKQAQEVVKLAPDDPEARTHMAIVLLGTGDEAMATKTLDKIIAGAEFGEALAYRGAIYYKSGDIPNAIATLERAAVADPRLAEAVGQMIDDAKSGVPLGGQDHPQAQASPPSGPMSGGMPEGPPSADDISGTLTVAPSAQAAAVPGATLFLFARAPGVDRGPPLWVKKLQVSSFPAEFRIGPGNAMMGGATPSEVVISARIDADGNAMTRSEADVEGKSGTLKPGAQGVSIVIGG